MNEMSGSHEPAHTPARSVEVLARRADGNSQSLNLRGESGDSREWHVVETVIYFVGENDNLMLDADVSYSLELFFRVDLADGIVCRSLLVMYSTLPVFI